MNCKENFHTCSDILFISAMKTPKMHELVDLHQGTCLFQTKKHENKNRQ